MAIGVPDTRQEAHGALQTDRAVLLSELNGEAILVVLAGVQWLATNRRLLSKEPRIVELLSSALDAKKPNPFRLMRTRDGKTYLGGPGKEGECIELSEELRRVGFPADADEYLYFNSDSDWFVYRDRDDGSKLVLDRPVRTDSGIRFDRMSEGEIFSGGQLAFDRVLAVTRDPLDASRLLAVTPRGFEVISDSPGAGLPFMSRLGLDQGEFAAPWNSVLLEKVSGHEGRPAYFA